MSFWVVYFLVLGIRDLMDARPLLKSSDVSFLSDHIRRQYRRRRGIAYLVICAISLCIFAAETIYKIRLDLRSALICFGIPYALPILYIIWLKKKYNVPGIWTKHGEN